MAHIPIVRDDGPRLVIDARTRRIEGCVVELVQGDHDSERIGFELPRYIDGHDMTEAEAFVNYSHEDSDEGETYPVDDLHALPNSPSTVAFTWLASRNVTQEPGKVLFLVKFRCYDGENVVYEWNTAKSRLVTVKEGMDYGLGQPEDYPDSVRSLVLRVEALEKRDAASIDPTLTIEGSAADAKAVGDALDDAKAYTDEQIAAIPTPDVSGQIGAHNADPDAHPHIQGIVSGLSERLNAVANSDDETLDQIAELVAYIKDNRTLIEQVTTGKVSVSDIVDNLATSASDKPLSAAQGVALKALIDAIVVPTNVSAFANDAGYAKSSDLANVATSGSYNDLTDKPFYENKSETVILEDTTPRTLGGPADGAKDGYGDRNGNLASSALVIGDTYVLTFDGVDYIGVAEWVEDTSSEGNNGVRLDFYAEGQSESFAGLSSYSNVMYWDFAEDKTYSPAVTFSVKHVASTVKTLDPKYLPDTVVTEEDIPEVVNAALAQAKESGEFDGADGYSPVRGTDYWTAADIAEIKSYVDNAILGGAW